MACKEVVRQRCQRASAKLKIIFDFKPHLTTGENVTTATPTSSPSGLTLAHVLVDNVATVLASGGTVGTTYRVTCTGQSADQAIPLIFDIEVIPD